MRERVERGSSRGRAWSVVSGVSWALGVALGVAIGAWLTAVGGAGAPGAAGIRIGIDLVVVPGIVFLTVLVAILVARGLVGVLRSRAIGDDLQHENGSEKP